MEIDWLNPDKINTLVCEALVEKPMNTYLGKVTTEQVVKYVARHLCINSAATNKIHPLIYEAMLPPNGPYGEDDKEWLRHAKKAQAIMPGRLFRMTASYSSCPMRRHSWPLSHPDWCYWENSTRFRYKRSIPSAAGRLAPLA